MVALLIDRFGTGVFGNFVYESCLLRFMENWVSVDKSMGTQEK